MTRDAGREPSIRRFRAVLIATALITGAFPAAAQSADHAGKAPYDRNCGVCHGLEGRGNVAPPLVPLERTFDEVLAIVREGRGEMPPVSANAVSDDAVRLIVDYLQAQQKKSQADLKVRLYEDGGAGKIAVGMEARRDDVPPRYSRQRLRRNRSPATYLPAGAAGAGAAAPAAPPAPAPRPRPPPPTAGTG